MFRAVKLPIGMIYRIHCGSNIAPRFTLELSLLDADQQLVVRRVIAVDPAVPSPPVLPPRGQWHVDATVDVRLPADLAQRDISGYRLTVFYP